MLQLCTLPVAFVLTKLTRKATTNTLILNKKILPRTLSQNTHFVFIPVHPAPQEGKEGVDQHEEHQRRKDPEKAPFIELPHCQILLDGNQPEGGNHHEQWNACPAYASVPESHPEAVGLIRKHAHVAGKAGSICCIEVFTSVDEHHEETGRNPKVIEERYAFHMFSFV